MFYSSPVNWDQVTQVQRCCWPLRFAYIIMQCIICKLNGATYLFTNIYCVIFHQDFLLHLLVEQTSENEV